MGWILIVTAALVLVPVALQLRAGEYSGRDFAGYLLFAAGLASVGAAERWSPADLEQTLMLAGLGLVLAGLIVARPGHRPGG